MSERYYRGYKWEYVHGRMDERHLEERMVDFINGDVDVGNHNHSGDRS